jgi:hypothetical protein
MALPRSLSPPIPLFGCRSGGQGVKALVYSAAKGRMANQSMSLSQNGAPLAIHAYLHVNVTKEQPEVERGRLVKHRHRHGAEQSLHTMSPAYLSSLCPAHPNAVGWDGSGASSVTVSLSGPGVTPTWVVLPAVSALADLCASEYPRRRTDTSRPPPHTCPSTSTFRAAAQRNCQRKSPSEVELLDSGFGDCSGLRASSDKSGSRAQHRSNTPTE